MAAFSNDVASRQRETISFFFYSALLIRIGFDCFVTAKTPSFQFVPKCKSSHEFIHTKVDAADFAQLVLFLFFSSPHFRFRMPLGVYKTAQVRRTMW